MPTRTVTIGNESRELEVLKTPLVQLVGGNKYIVDPEVSAEQVKFSDGTNLAQTLSTFNTALKTVDGVMNFTETFNTAYGSDATSYDTGGIENDPALDNAGDTDFKHRFDVAYGEDENGNVLNCDCRCHNDNEYDDPDDPLKNFEDALKDDETAGGAGDDGSAGDDPLANFEQALNGDD